jgi:hypothetical protein
MTNVTLVTAQSEKKSPQTPEEWRDVYDDLKGDLSFGKFKEKYNIGLSRAAWDKYERGLMPLSNDMKAELRRAVGLPVPVLEAVAVADPNAAVYRIGTETPHTVVMVGTTSPVELRINGVVTATETTAVNSHALPVRATQEKRRRYWRTCMSLEQKERTEALNQGKPPELQMTPQEIYDMGLKACGVTE